MVTLTLITGVVYSNAEKKEVSKAIFYVGWYDIGKAALDGLKGVISVEKGFHNSKEINTVFYDPSVITIKEMENALREAGTYQGMVE